MNLRGHREYTVIEIASASVRVCRFVRKAARYRVAGVASEAVRSDDVAHALRTAFRTAGGDTGSPVILTGCLTGGVFFQTESVELDPREMKSSLEFEIPRHVPKMPDDCRFQFLCDPPRIPRAAHPVPANRTTPSDSSASVPAPTEVAVATDPDADESARCAVKVYAFARTGMDRMAAVMTQCKIKADEYIFPFLGLHPEDPPGRMEAVDPDYEFYRGAWRLADRDASFLSEWRTVLEKTLILPETSFPLSEMLACCLVMRLLAEKEPVKMEFGLRAVPRALRPARCRTPLRIFIFLLVILLGWGCVEAVSGRVNVYREYAALDRQRKILTRKISDLKAKHRKAEKEQKELVRVLKLTVGETDAIHKLAALSRALPADMLVTSLRMNDSTLDLTIQTESTNENLNRDLRGLTWWKVGQVTTRSMSDTLKMLTVRLVPSEEAAP